MLDKLCRPAHLLAVLQVMVLLLLLLLLLVCRVVMLLLLLLVSLQLLLGKPFLLLV
jgi:hypothetical protein